MFIILGFRFEIYRTFLLDETNNDANTVSTDVVKLLYRSNRVEQRVLVRIFIYFCNDLAFQQAIYSKAFFCDSESTRFYLWADRFRSINPSRGTILIANSFKSTSGVALSLSANTRV